MLAKLLSGKFILALVVGISLVVITILVCMLALRLTDEQMIVQVVSSLILVVASAISSVITFYFTKKAMEDQRPPE